MNGEIIDAVVKAAGGPVHVAGALGLHRNTIGKWIKAGWLPDSEYLPGDHPDRTDYTTRIIAMSAAAGADFTIEDLLNRRALQGWEELEILVPAERGLRP